MADFSSLIGEGAVIAITIKAIDEFSGELKHAQTSIMGFSGETVASMAEVGTAVVAAGAVLMDFAKEAAEAEDQQVSFNRVLGSDGPRVLAQMQEATLGTVDKFKLMSAATSAVNRGINEEALPAIAQFAQRLADSDPQFENTVSTINDISTAIATGRTMTLARMGIMVDAKTAEENFAKANGLVANSLNETQKKAALQIEIMDQLQKKIQSLPAPTVDTADKMKQLNAQFTEAKITIGEQVAPAFEEFLTAVQPLIPQLVKLAIEVMPAVNIVIKGLAYFVYFLEQGFEALNSGVQGIIAVFIGWKILIGEIIDEIKTLINWIGKVSFGAFKGVSNAVGSITGAKKMNDFIITSSGQVIEPSPQDTIMGMKNPGGQGIVINIDSIYGIDAKQISRALKDELLTKVNL